MHLLYSASRFSLYYMSLIYFITFKNKIANNMWRYITILMLILFKSSGWLLAVMVTSAVYRLLLTELQQSLSTKNLECHFVSCFASINWFFPFLFCSIGAGWDRLKLILYLQTGQLGVLLLLILLFVYLVLLALYFFFFSK